MGTVVKVALTGAIIVGACLLATVAQILPGANAGFGPEWKCVNAPRGGQICLRQPVPGTLTDPADIQ